MKVAVVHDYFTQQGGAERVAEELYQMVPGSALFTTVALKERMPMSLRDAAVHTSWMQFAPGIKTYFRMYFLFYPLAVQALDVSQYDLVLSSSSGYAKGVRASRNALHVCYCHTPMRWVWNFNDYSSREGMGAAYRKVLKAGIAILRQWDENASREPDHFIANSHAVAKRIRATYGRVSEVIHPPVDVDRFHVADEQEDYFVVLSRLVSYKRLDLAVKACTMLKRKLIVIGDGPHRKQLMSEAGESIQFVGRLPDAEVERVVSRCRALIFPGEEDFGIAPLEVAAAGRPCIAYRAGGAVETIVDGVTGMFFNEQTPEHLAASIEEFERTEWSQSALRKHAECFRREVFQERMRSFLAKAGCPLPAQEQLPDLSAHARRVQQQICA